MKMLWCWRCKMYVPMLDEDETQIAGKLYKDALRSKSESSISERMNPLLDYYEMVTGVQETNPKLYYITL